MVERHALERRVTESLEAGRIPVVLGPCGSGRSSLLWRLEDTLGHARAQYLDMAAAATTPERCLAAVLGATRLPSAAGPHTASTTAGAFTALLDYFDHAHAPVGSATFLLDEFLDVRTFEHFPGLRAVQLDFVTRLASSPSRFVLASRFTARVHRLLRDAPPRFEVIHMPPFEAGDVEGLARAMGDGPARPSDLAGIAALSNGHVASARILLATLQSLGPGGDPIAAMAAAFALHGPLTARWRECYELRLHRARGYGALKAILGILADTEPLNLTEISQRLSRTPGSTKDYLSWLEDVDLVVMRGKRYFVTEPLLRLFVRLHARPVPPSDDDVVREVTAYARTRVAALKATPPPTPAAEPAPAMATADASDPAASGIIEID